MDTSILNKVLTNVGLSEGEIRVFSFLVSHGGSVRATEIARKTRTNRTTLYGILNNLIERGLVSSSGDVGVSQFQSVEPRTILTLIERTKKTLEKNAEEIETILPALESARKASRTSYPRVQFFEGVEGIRQVYEDTVTNNTDKKMFGFINYETAIQTLGEEWAHYFIQKRKREGIFAETIATQTEAGKLFKSKDKNQLRSIRFFPREYKFDIEIITYGNKTALMSFDKDNPVAILIEDKKIAETFKNLFLYVNNSLSSQEKVN